MKKKLIIIIPAYNEGKTISKVIHDIPKIEGVIQEIIVIDDGSIDRTYTEAKKAGAKVISNKKNLGLGTSFKIGLKVALKNKADIIVNLDADGQYEPNQIPILVKTLLKKNVDLVIGNRFLNDKYLGNNLLKRWGNKFISIFISKILLKQTEIID
ncbi:MAG: glycosyltransferase family 2 protein, partial [Promethearchaeota archaeon]